jgi:hypothetical protein
MDLEQAWLPNISDDLRDAVQELMRHSEEGTLGSAFVLRGHGMFVSTIRAFLSGAFLLAGSREPYRIFAEAEAAADWLAPIAGAGAPWTPAQVRSGLRRLRQDGAGIAST